MRRNPLSLDPTGSRLVQVSREQVGTQEALGCLRAAVSPKLCSDSLSPTGSLAVPPVGTHGPRGVPARPPALYLQSFFLDAALFQVIKEAIGAGWLGQGRWRPLAVTAMAGTLRWQHLDVSRGAGPVPPRPGGRLCCKHPCILGDKSPSTPSRTRHRSPTGRDPSLGTERAKFVLDHAPGQWQAYSLAPELMGGNGLIWVST